MATITSTSSTTDTTTNPNSTLTQANFLQLLVTQMTSQDPLNPESDTDFAAQLAQFSNLQESTAMAGNLSGIQAQSLIGATVQIPSGTQTISGVVSGINISNGVAQVVVNNQPYPLSQVTSVIPTPVTTPASSSSTTSN